MKLVFGVVVGFFTAAVVHAGLLFLTLAIGGTECDRSACNFVGEAAADEVVRWVLGLGFVALALALGATAARSVR